MTYKTIKDLSKHVHAVYSELNEYKALVFYACIFLAYLIIASNCMYNRYHTLKQKIKEHTLLKSN